MAIIEHAYGGACPWPRQCSESLARGPPNPHNVQKYSYVLACAGTNSCTDLVELPVLCEPWHSGIRNGNPHGARCMHECVRTCRHKYGSPRPCAVPRLSGVYMHNCNDTGCPDTRMERVLHPAPRKRTRCSQAAACQASAQCTVRPWSRSTARSLRVCISCDIPSNLPRSSAMSDARPDTSLCQCDVAASTRDGRDVHFAGVARPDAAVDRCVLRSRTFASVVAQISSRCLPTRQYIMPISAVAVPGRVLQHCTWSSTYSHSAPFTSGDLYRSSTNSNDVEHVCKRVRKRRVKRCPFTDPRLCPKKVTRHTAPEGVEWAQHRTNEVLNSLPCCFSPISSIDQLRMWPSRCFVCWVGQPHSHKHRMKCTQHRMRLQDYFRNHSDAIDLLLELAVNTDTRHPSYMAHTCYDLHRKLLKEHPSVFKCFKPTTTMRWFAFSGTPCMPTVPVPTQYFISSVMRGSARPVPKDARLERATPADLVKGIEEARQERLANIVGHDVPSWEARGHSQGLHHHSQAIQHGDLCTISRVWHRASAGGEL